VKSLLILLAVAGALSAAEIRGTLTLAQGGQAVGNMTVLLLPNGVAVESDAEGRYRFADLAAGKYTLLASGEGLSSGRRSVELKEGAMETVDLTLAISPVRDEITVTASGARVETTLETFSPTLSLDTTALAGKAATSLGDVLDGEAGVHRRSFGPGTTRPVIRGFDGDRVLILQDGMRTGTLGSLSGDHGEPVDPQGLERVEVVRGPATLLYGSNAIGGVVNMVTGHHEARSQGHRGIHGYLSGIAGTNNGLHGSSAGLDYGLERWVFRLGGGGQRTSDYRTPVERIFNSRSRNFSGHGGASYYGASHWLTGSYNVQRSFYQLPAEAEADGKEDEEEGDGHERVALPLERWSLRLQGGARNLLQYGFNYSDYRHQELEGGEVGTRFFNKTFDYRALVEQKRSGPFSGSFGVWGLRRDYEAKGDEAIVPPTSQNAFAVYGVESVDLERWRFQFGGRVETNRYKPLTGRARNFTGFSGSAGVTYRLDEASSLVANFSRAYRAPALEELYANGPHPGLQAFEIGQVNLNRERMHGLDFSYRRQDTRLRTEFNFFHYRLADQVYLAPNGEFEDGLPVANYGQNDSTFTGVDARLMAGLRSWLWLNLGFDAVRTELLDLDLGLPRTPPVRGRLGLDWRWKSWSVAPEWVLALRQDRVFRNETETAGYGVVNVRANYTLVRRHAVHLFGLNWFNANNMLYRNHLSFLKQIAPEMGRGVAFNYSLRFF
jgi:iron complex outermembrane receptor protein